MGEPNEKVKICLPVNSANRLSAVLSFFSIDPVALSACRPALQQRLDLS
jgi:hypothetical protein